MAIVTAAGVGGLAGVLGVVASEPLRSWSKRREDEREAIEEFAAVVAGFIFKVHEAQVSGQVTSALTVEHLLEPLRVVQTKVIVRARRKPLALSRALLDTCGALAEAVEAQDRNEADLDRLTTRVGVERMAMLLASRPSWRRAPRSMRNIKSATRQVLAREAGRD